VAVDTETGYVDEDKTELGGVEEEAVVGCNCNLVQSNEVNNFHALVAQVDGADIDAGIPFLCDIPVRVHHCADQSESMGVALVEQILRREEAHTDLDFVVEGKGARNYTDKHSRDEAVEISWD